MKSVRAIFCILLAVLMPSLSVVGNTLPPAKASRVQTGITIGGALIGMGMAGATAYFLVPEGTVVTNRLLVVIPVAGVAAATGAVAGHWMADTTLKLEPPLLLSPLIGAGLGMLGAALVGGISFAVAIAIAFPMIEAPPGYWGSDFTYLQAVGMAVLAGTFWGGIIGIPVGAVTVPIISIYMGF